MIKKLNIWYCYFLLKSNNTFLDEGTVFSCHFVVVGAVVVHVETAENSEGIDRMSSFTIHLISQDHFLVKEGVGKNCSHFHFLSILDSSIKDVLMPIKNLKKLKTIHFLIHKHI